MKNKNYKSNQRKDLLGKGRYFLSVFFLVAAMLWPGIRAQAQVATYNYATSAGTYTEITGGTVVSTSAWDDNVSSLITIPSFVYNGSTVTAMSISANGWISIGGTAASTSTSVYTALSSSVTATGAAGVICPFARDQMAGTGGEVRWQTVGSETIIQWKNWRFYNSTGGTGSLNYQIRLNHTTNTVSFVYGTMNTGTNTTSPQVGIKNGTAAGTIGTTMLNLTLKNIPSGTSCLTWSDAVRGRLNSETMLFSSSAPVATVASGTTFTLTPQTGASTGWVSPVTTFSAVSGITSNGATIGWTAPTNANSYNVQFRRAIDCAWTNFSGNPVSSTTATLSGLVDGTVYHVRVQPFNSTTSRTAGYSNIPPQAGGASADGYVAAGTFTTLTLPCSGTPTAGTIPSTAGFCGPSGTVSLTATGFTTGVSGITLQWQESADNVNWANVTGGTGATTASYTSATLSATTYFRCLVTCTSSTLSATTNVCTASLVNCSYDVSGPSPASYTSIMPANGGSGLTYSGWVNTSGDDNTSSAVSLTGTTFKYRGSPVTGFRACSNGWMTFNTTTTSTAFSNDVSATGQNQLLAPFWDDLVVTGQAFANMNNSMRYQIDGTLGSGSAVITIEWAGIERFNIPGPNLNFQVKLYEAGDIVEFIYGNFEGFDGTFTGAYSYSIGYNGTSPATASANERFNMSTAVTNHWTTTASNSNVVMPDCFTKFTLTPGTYTGPTTAPAIPVPSNDERGTAVSLTANGLPCTSYCGTYFTSRAATNSGAGQACATAAGNEDDDVYFLFSTTSASDYLIRLRCSPGYDGVIELLDGNSNPIQCVNATAAGGIETINATGLNAGGESYYIRVFHNGTGSGTSGQFSLCINEVIPPPSNDDICGAVSLTTATTCVPVPSIMPNTLSATASPETVCGGTADDDVWYSWTANVGNPTFTVQSGTGYNAHVQIYSSSDNTCGGTLTSLGCFNSTSTGGAEIVNGTNLVLGNTYFIRVYHTGAGAASGLFTVCVTGSTPACGTLTAPADLASVVASPVNLSWATVTNASGYDVYVDQNNPPTTLVSGNQTALTYDYTPTTPTAGQTYYWMVVPRNGLGASSSAPCFVRSFTLAAPACPVLTAPANGFSSTSGSETLSWTASTGATGYNVFIDNNATPVTQVSANQADTSYGPYATTPGNIYYWTVNGIGAYGTSSGCAAFSFNTNPPACVTAPTSPADAGFFCSDNGTVTLTWPASPGSTGYDVVLDGVTVSAAQAGTSYTSGALSYGSHTWSVLPLNSNGPASGCATWTFDLRPKPTVSASSNLGCIGQNLNLNASNDIGTVFGWTGPNGFTSTDEDPVITAITSADAGDYVFTASLNGCSSSATATVAVNAVPVIAGITATPAAICEGQSTQLSATLPGPNYCLPSQSSGSCGGGDEYIANVNFGAGLINNASTCAQSLPAGYTDYTSVSANVTAGTTYPITVSNPNFFSGDQCRVWADWNRNGVFTDAGETFILTGTTSFTGSVIVPAGALNGSTRMRVQVLYNTTPTPCNTSGFSESEDYTLVVSGGVAPTVSGNFSWDNAGTLSNPAIANPVATPASSTNYTVTLTANGCSTQGTVGVTVNPNPVASSTPGTIVCLGGTTTVNVSAVGGTPTYTGTGAFTAGAGAYSYTVTDANGCTSVTTGTLADGNPAVTYYQDADGDGFGNAAAPQVSCTGVPAGYVVNSTDCNDNQLQYADNDGDGFGAGSPVACGVSNNSDCNDNQILYADIDGDGFGAVSLAACGVTNNTDCNDGNATAFPGGTEVCDGVDNDCDGLTDEDLTLATPAVINGTASACVAGVAGSANFSVAAIPGATTYNWTPPAGCTISAGQGTSSITLSWTATAVQSGIIGQLCVIASNPCVSSSQRCLAINYQVSAPLTPGSISGPGKLCPGEVATFSASTVARATSYNWTVPTGMLIQSGQGSSVITVSVVAGFTGGNVTVTASNPCGTSGIRSRSLTQNLPGTPGLISGAANGLCNTSGNLYSIAPVAAANSYNWTTTTGTTITSGNGTTSILLNVGQFGGSATLSVQAVNGCGSSLARSLTISGIPARPASITGLFTVCAGSVQPYSVATITGASAYNWAVTPGGVLSSGQGTKNVTITWGAPATGRAISVATANACGSSLTFTRSGISITNCGRMSEQSTAANMVVYPNPARDFVTIEFNAQKATDYRLRITDMSGRIAFSQESASDESLNRIQVPSGTLAAGIYMVTLEIDGTQQMTRLMVE